MWILYAFGSAIFAGATSILAKIGIKNVDSHLVTALRTVVVLLFSWLMVFIIGSQTTISEISSKSFIFLILSGLATGASWLCYFKALQLGNVNKVVAIDKSSTLLTMILAFIFLGESLTFLKVIAVVLIGFGTYYMMDKKIKLSISNLSFSKLTSKLKTTSKFNSGWFIYAILSAVFAALTSILAKVGIENVESNLGTAIRTIVVLIMSIAIVFITKKQKDIKKIDKRNLLFIFLSGFATGASWLCYYKALQTGPASVVVPIDKLSILITVGFAYMFLKEKISKRAFCGLLFICVGTLSLLLKI